MIKLNKKAILKPKHYKKKKIEIREENYGKKIKTKNKANKTNVIKTAK